eukprot:124367_1
MVSLLHILALISINCLVESVSMHGYELWTNVDFYYRAIAARYLRVLYYTNDHSNILNTETLTEIHNIEKQIKSWPGYHDHALVYKERDNAIESLFSTTSSLYLESAPSSVINFVFPQNVLEYMFMNGNGNNINEQWTDNIFEFPNSQIWLNKDTFNTHSGTLTSPFLLSFYPFGYKNKNETKDDLIAFVDSYSQLFDTVTSEHIAISYSNSVYYPEIVALNDKIYEYIPTPQPTQTPTVNYSETIFVVPCYQFGYSISTGKSSGAIIAALINQTTSTNVPTVAPVSAPEPTGYPSYPTSAPTTDQTELCRETFWPRYTVDVNSNDIIYFEDYQWNLIDGNSQYYCNVLVKDISFCDGQWQSVDNGQYVDITLVYNPLITSDPTQSDPTQSPAQSPTLNPLDNESNAYIFGTLNVLIVVLIILAL